MIGVLCQGVRSRSLGGLSKLNIEVRIALFSSDQVEVC